MDKNLTAIFTTLIIAFISWAAFQIVANASNIIRLEERNKTLKELIIEIKDDVKEIKKAVTDGGVKY